MKHLIYRFYEDIICIPMITPYWAMCIGKERRYGLEESLLPLCYRTISSLDPSHRVLLEVYLILIMKRTILL